MEGQSSASEEGTVAGLRRCPLCLRNWSSSLQAHLMQYHCASGPKSSAWHCGVCSFSSASFDTAAAHCLHSAHDARALHRPSSLDAVLTRSLYALQQSTRPQMLRPPLDQQAEVSTVPLPRVFTPIETGLPTVLPKGIRVAGQAPALVRSVELGLGGEPARVLPLTAELSGLPPPPLVSFSPLPRAASAIAMTAGEEEADEAQELMPPPRQGRAKKSIPVKREEPSAQKVSIKPEPEGAVSREEAEKQHQIQPPLPLQALPVELTEPTPSVTVTETPVRVTHKRASPEGKPPSPPPKIKAYFLGSAGTSSSASLAAILAGASSASGSAPPKLEPQFVGLPQLTSATAKVDRRNRTRAVRLAELGVATPGEGLEQRTNCALCSRSVKTSGAFGKLDVNSLENHVLTHHVEEKPYKCAYCERSFAINHNCKRHVKTQHKHHDWVNAPGRGVFWLQPGLEGRLLDLLLRAFPKEMGVWAATDSNRTNFPVKIRKGAAPPPDGHFDLPLGPPAELPAVEAEPSHDKLEA